MDFNTLEVKVLISSSRKDIFLTECLRNKSTNLEYILSN